MKIKLFYLLQIILLLLMLCFPITSFGANETILDIGSESVILVERNTGKILYEKNAFEKKYMASTTKVMTAILAIEYCEDDLSQKATASYDAIVNIPSGYTKANIQIGEELSVEQLLYALLLPSGNDAANVLAEHVAGSIYSFSSMMNTKAQELGCTNTNFTNPSGLHEENHYSCCYDLYLIANYAMKNPIFRKIVSTTTYTLPETDKYPQSDRVLKNTNDLLNNSSKYFYSYAYGGKTGYTKYAKNCLISYAKKDDIDLICVVLGADSTNKDSIRYSDTIQLFNYGFENYKFNLIKSAKDLITTIQISNGSKETKNLNLLLKDNISALVNVSDASNIEYSVETNSDELLAPISSGEILGKVIYTVDGIKYSSDLIAENDVVPKSYFKIVLLILIIIFVFLLFILKIISNHDNKRHKKYRKSKHSKKNKYRQMYEY